MPYNCFQVRLKSEVDAAGIVAFHFGMVISNDLNLPLPLYSSWKYSSSIVNKFYLIFS